MFITFFLRYSQNFFMQSLSLYTSYLFPMSLNNDVVDMEKPDGIRSFTFAVDDLSRLFFDTSIFSIRDSRPA